MLTRLENGWSVESWWDRSIRSWTTQIRDADGNQVGDALYDAHRERMELTHKAAVEQAASNP